MSCSGSIPPVVAGCAFPVGGAAVRRGSWRAPRRRCVSTYRARPTSCATIRSPNSKPPSRPMSPARPGPRTGRDTDGRDDQQIPDQVRVRNGDEVGCEYRTSTLEFVNSPVLFSAEGHEELAAALADGNQARVGAILERHATLDHRRTMDSTSTATSSASPSPPSTSSTSSGTEQWMRLALYPARRIAELRGSTGPRRPEDGVRVSPIPYVAGDGGDVDSDCGMTGTALLMENGMNCRVRCALSCASFIGWWTLRSECIQRQTGIARRLAAAWV